MHCDGESSFWWRPFDCLLEFFPTSQELAYRDSR